MTSADNMYECIRSWFCLMIYIILSVVWRNEETHFLRARRGFHGVFQISIYRDGQGK